MSSCPFFEDIGPWLDGQLPPERATRIERHLHDCPRCRREAEALRALQDLCRTVAWPGPSAELTEALHRHADRAPALDIFRLAEWLAGAAAAIIVVCGLVLGLSHVLEAEPGMPSQWELSAMSGQTDPEEPRSQQLALWFAADLSEETPR